MEGVDTAEQSVEGRNFVLDAACSYRGLKW
jgi:hypothetical protein